MRLEATRPLVSGVAWGLGSQGVAQVIRLGVVFLLARLLEPRDFGIVAACLIFAEMGSRVASLGLLPALVQRARLEPQVFSTAFWLSLVTGGALYGGLLVAAPWIARLLLAPEAEQVVRWLAVSFLPAAASAVPAALLTRNLRFRALAVANTVSVLLAGALAVTLAFQGLGVKALVANTVAAHLFRFMAVTAASGWRPTLHWDRSELRGLLGFGFATLGSGLLGVANTRLDLLLIGRLLGMTPLGYYSLAIRLVEGPRARFAAVFGRVLLAVGSRRQEDPSAFRGVCSQTLKQQCLLLWPPLIGLAALAPEFLEIVMGEPWMPAAGALQVVCFVACVRSVNSFCGAVLNATGRPHLQLVAALVALAGAFPAVWLAAPLGIAAVATAILALSTGVLILQVALFPSRMFSAGDLVAACRNPAGVASAIGGGLVVSNMLLRKLEWSSEVRLGLLTAAAGLVFAGVILRAHRDRVAELFRSLRGGRTAA